MKKLLGSYFWYRVLCTSTVNKPYLGHFQNSDACNFSQTWHKNLMRMPNLAKFLKWTTSVNPQWILNFYTLLKPIKKNMGVPSSNAKIDAWDSTRKTYVNYFRILHNLGHLKRKNKVSLSQRKHENEQRNNLLLWK